MGDFADVLTQVFKFDAICGAGTRRDNVAVVIQETVNSLWKVCATDIRVLISEVDLQGAVGFFRCCIGLPALQ